MCVADEGKVAYLKFADDEDVKDEYENEWDGESQRERVEGESGLAVHEVIFWPVDVATDAGVRHSGGNGRGHSRRVVQLPGSGRRRRGVGPVDGVQVVGAVETAETKVRFDLLSVGVEEDGHDHEERDGPGSQRHGLMYSRNRFVTSH